ncbi:MAG: LacI family DNA-binding transcriptional regulator, partial [Lachnospiraceae bacterium]|nr:LacI family DNA-binding transcriptional regulator [Lachnospiraceae bacterium]
VLNYLGGPEDNEEDRERYRAFCDCLSAHGIRVEKKRVLHKNFLKAQGREAYSDWKKWGVNMADAVICANDYMALGYVEEAEKDGIQIPDYMKVTGFDDIEDAGKSSPSITTVNRNWKQLGYESLDALIEALNGNTEFDTRFIEGYVCFNESCGCDLTRDIRADYIKMLRKSKKDMANMTIHTNLRQILLSSKSIEEFREAMARCNAKLDIEDVAVCLSESFFEGDVDREKTGYDENITILSAGGRYETKRSE